VESATLAQQTVDVLAALLNGRVGEAETRAADRVYDSVAVRLRTVGRDSVLFPFENAPTALGQQSVLVAVLTEELDSDALFRDSLSVAVRAASHPPTGPMAELPPLPAANDDTATYPLLPAERSGTRRRYGRVVIGVIAVTVVTLVVVFGGAVYAKVTDVGAPAAGRMDAGPTSRGYLGADAVARADVLNRRYLALDEPRRAADPLLVRDADRACGDAPDVALGTVVTR
jgi:hypothetical protein